MLENHDDKTVSFFLDCNNLGAQFVHAVADDVTVADILEPIYVPDIVNSFFLMNGVLNKQGISKPLLAVQVTELVDGFFHWLHFKSLSDIATGIKRFITAYLWERDKEYNPPLPKEYLGNAVLFGNRSSPRFNVYGNDFGWGRPITVRSGVGNKFDGKLTVFPGAEEGSMDFEACLLHETLQAMADDAEFMEALTS
uniref:Uncharacterized protein n=1 Tax=Fagus sylvatica TaxID=28930 RepID=A0A2N9G1T9_FAGSY